jgi:hypothetical protein
MTEAKKSAATAEAGDVADVFADIDALRLSPDVMIGAREVLAHVAVRKPTYAEFVRVHPKPDMTLPTSIFVDQVNRETYFVVPEMRSILTGGVKLMTLVTTVNQRGTVFLWPLGLGDGGRRNVWHDTAREAAEMAKREWIKIVPDMPAGQYRIYTAEGNLGDPVWPDKTLNELLRVAFRGRIIDSEDHLIVQQARGRIA